MKCEFDTATQLHSAIINYSNIVSCLWPTQLHGLSMFSSDAQHMQADRWLQTKLDANSLCSSKSVQFDGFFIGFHSICKALPWARPVCNKLELVRSVANNSENLSRNPRTDRKQEYFSTNSTFENDKPRRFLHYQQWNIYLLGYRDWQSRQLIIIRQIDKNYIYNWTWPCVSNQSCSGKYSR